MQSRYCPFLLPRIGLPPDGGWYYRGEGNANLVISLVSCRSVIRFTKSKYYDKDHNADTLEITEYVNNIMRPRLGERFVRQLYVGCLSDEDFNEVKTRIQPFRPLKRTKKDIKGSIVIVSPDCTFLTPEYERNTIGDTISVEIKPKEGWHSPKLFYSSDLCHRCLKYSAKTPKNELASVSPYCPLDLFSGSPSRCKRALFDLYDFAHGRFKVFRNGEVLYNEDSQGTEAMEDGIKSFFGVGCLRKDVRELLCSLLYAALMNQGSSEEFLAAVPKEEKHFRLKCDESPHIPLPEGSVLQALLSIQKYPLLSDRKAKFLADKFIGSEDDLDKINTFVHRFQPEKKGAFTDLTPPSSLSQEIESLQKYLMSITARDVSIFLTFREIKDADEEDRFREMKAPEWESVISLKENRYRAMISVIDLDPKPLHRISKWVETKEEWIASLNNP